MSPWRGQARVGRRNFMHEAGRKRPESENHGDHGDSLSGSDFKVAMPAFSHAVTLEVFLTVDINSAWSWNRFHID
jgi:hypothetical protein